MFLSSTRGAPKLQDEVCFLRLPLGFPAVPRRFVHTGLSGPPVPTENSYSLQCNGLRTRSVPENLVCRAVIC